MADSDYTVAVVLQASDEGMSSALKKTSDGVKEAGNSARKAQFDFLTLVVGLETLTSGLNQGVGGLRKFSSALRETGRFTDEQSQAMNRQIANIELVTGPMETLIAVQKLLTVVTFGAATAKNADAGASGAATLANYGYGASIVFVTGTLFAVVGILAILYIAWQNQDVILEKLNVGLAITIGLYNTLAASARNAADGAREFAETISDSFDVLRPGGGNGPEIAMGAGGLA